MSFSVLPFIVIGQVVVFQFTAVAFTRSLFAMILGPSTPSLPGNATAYLRQESRRRFMLGGVLLLVTMASLMGLPANPAARKLLLTLASLVSTGAFIFALITDRRAMRSMRDHLPNSGTRRASLQPRRASKGYGTAWELIPITILGATVGVGLTLLQQLGHIPTAMWLLQSLQAAFVLAALVYTMRHGTAVPNVSSRLAMLRHQPELALEFGEQIAAQEMRYFVFAKIGVTLLLGVGTVQVAMKSLGHPAAHILQGVSWAIIALLLVLYTSFVIQTVMLVKQAEGRNQQNPQTENAMKH